ncbi:MAG: hypothetical protein MUE50_26405, partial [Pirellulaceae bacterium]|nr:hypothetical protein [Pirellulaceae bacterium]
MTKKIAEKTLKAATSRRTPKCCRVLALVFVQLMGGAAAAADGPPKLPRAAPQQVGMNAARLAVIGQLVGDEIEDGEMAGAV